MSTQASFALRGRNPDVLTCIANLSNDEVFTPPEFANRMLDTLAEAWSADHKGAELWADKSVRFLDPCTKSGVFLREITSRLTKGLAAEIPDLEKRVDHILTKQVFGIGITYLTSLLARRSLYCSKHAKGKHSIAKSFETDNGNIWFKRTEHTWADGKCTYCGASQATFEHREGLETHAYAFIHNGNIKTRMAELFGGDMQFDVIIGNPPYQLDDGGYGTSAAPIYQLFVEKALDLDPRYAVFVTPSRWMAGGKGLDKYRERMLSDRRMRNIVDYPKLYEGFPGVKIRGGISYFLWDRDHNGPCEVQTIWDGKPTGPAVARYLNSYDILVRRNEAVPILDKAAFVEQLRRQRWTGVRIAQATGLSRASVSRLLTRLHLNTARSLEPAVPIIRYEHAAPGDLLHIDIKKLARIVNPGHRLTGNPRDETRGAGWEFLYVAVDDHSRIAFTALLPNEKGASASQFLREAVAYFARLSITVRRVMTDNGPCFCSRRFLATCRRLRIRPIRTRIVQLPCLRRESRARRRRLARGQPSHVMARTKKIMVGDTFSNHGCGIS